MIRPASPNDAKSVAPLIMLAMGSLAHTFSNTDDVPKTREIFEYFFRLKNNQYSYEHTLVFENNQEIAGAIIGYDGARLVELRKVFLEFLMKEQGLKDFDPEPETEAGEFYLDTIGVSPEAQGKGIGKQLIGAILQHARQQGFKKAGLIVDKNNLPAKKLYTNLGFQIEKEKKFIGDFYFHMVIAL